MVRFQDLVACQQVNRAGYPMGPQSSSSMRGFRSRPVLLTKAQPGRRSDGNSGILPHWQGFEKPDKLLVEPLNYQFSWTFAISSALTFLKLRLTGPFLTAKLSFRTGGLVQSQSQNSETAIKDTLKLIKALPDFKMAESVCCMEHTVTADRGHL